MKYPSRLRPAPHWRVALAVVAGVLSPAPVRAASPDELAAAYATQSGASPSPASGQQFFTARHGREWSCASCHGNVPIQAGRHAVTGKPIGALAPAFDPERFSDADKVEKWFRRNCKDVVGRECTAAEKADVIGWLMTLKP